MHSVQDLLDKLGPPTPEICLDWAWQLVSIAGQIDCPPTLAWTELEVTQHGKLSLDRYAKSQFDNDSILNSHRKPTELISQLLEWAVLDSADIEKAKTLDAQVDLLTAFTSRLLHGAPLTVPVPRVVDSEASSKVRANASDAEMTSEEAAPLSGQAADTLADFHLGTVDFDALPSVIAQDDFAQESKVEEIDVAIRNQTSATDLVVEESDGSMASSNAMKSPKRTTTGTNSLKNHKVLLLAGSGLSLVAIATFAIFAYSDKSILPNTRADKSNAAGSHDSQSSALSSSYKSTASDNPTSSKRSSQSGRTTEEHIQRNAALGSSGEDNREDFSLSATTDFNDGASISSEPLVKPMLSADLPATASADPSSTLATLGTLNSLPQTIVAKPTAADKNDASSVHQDARDAESNNDDLALLTKKSESVVEMLSGVASAEPSIHKLNDVGNDESARSGPRTLAVQLLDVETMEQVQELPAKLRLREPHWELRVATTSAFTVEPSGLQSLAERDTARWILTAKDLKPRKDQQPTQVAVFARLTGRRGDIKWTIVAGSQDVPVLPVPLNEKKLNLMLDMVQSNQQLMSARVDQIKNAVEASKFSKEQKAMLSANRRTLESEIKLLGRARQIIADASMLASWMDRTLEVHGRLSDQFGGQSTVLLEIGQLEPQQQPKTTGQ